MVVRFPSESESGAGRDSGDGASVAGAPVESAEDRLAPVTYLSRGSRGSEHPSLRGRSGEPAATDAVSARPVVALPSAGSVSQGEGDPEAAGDPGAAEKQVKRASNVSIHQLARRGMSRWELEQVLAKREIEPAVAQAELDRLESVGLLDDAALAVTLVYTQHNRKGLGRSAIAQELNRRHIAPEHIEEALSEIADDDELERATELAMKRVGQLSSYDDETAKRRLHGFLSRKGYSSTIVRQAMDAALATRGRRGGVRFQ